MHLRARRSRSRAPTSIAEILTNVEGVDVGAAVGKTGGQTINIRGMGSDYTLILIDGRRQNTAGSVTPNGFGETSTSFLPPVSAIERIEVVRGPVSTLYGSDAMGGVVNIITRKVGDVWAGSASANTTLQGDDEFGRSLRRQRLRQRPAGRRPARPGRARQLLGRAKHSDLTYRERHRRRGAGHRLRPQRRPRTRSGRSAARLSLTPHADHDLWLDVDASQPVVRQRQAARWAPTPPPAATATALEFNRDQAVLAHNWRCGFGTLRIQPLATARPRPSAASSPTACPAPAAPRTLETDNTIFDTKLISQWRNHTFTVGGQYWDAEMVDGVAPGTVRPFTQWALFAEDEWRFTDDPGPDPRRAATTTTPPSATTSARAPIWCGTPTDNWT